jgi:hypothetical protein
VGSGDVSRGIGVKVVIGLRFGVESLGKRLRFGFIGVEVDRRLKIGFMLFLLVDLDVERGVFGVGFLSDVLDSLDGFLYLRRGSVERVVVFGGFLWRGLV